MPNNFTARRLITLAVAGVFAAGVAVASTAQPGSGGTLRGLRSSPIAT
jgi:hypothetical protein